MDVLGVFQDRFRGTLVHMACISPQCEFNRTSPEFNWTAYFNWTGHLQDHGYVAVGARHLRPVSGGLRVSQEAYGIRTGTP